MCKLDEGIMFAFAYEKIGHYFWRRVDIVNIIGAGVLATQGASYRHTLQWRHNEHNGVSNNWHPDGLFNRNIKAPRHRPLWVELTGDRRIPPQRASNAENVSIWIRHFVDLDKPGSFSPSIIIYCGSNKTLINNAYHTTGLLMKVS